MADRRLAVAAWESLFRTQVTIMRALAAEFPTDQLSMNEYDVLFNIVRAPGRRLRLKELNRTVLITQPSVSRLIDRLVARGFVAKIADPDDGRGTFVAVTQAGFETFREIAIEHMTTINALVGAALSSDELHQLATLTERLREKVNHTCQSSENYDLNAE